MASTSPRTLATIRMAMTSGIIAFLTFAYYTRHSADAPAPTGDVGFMRWFALGASIVAVLGMGFLRTRLSDVSVERRNSLSVIGWAIGEFGAIAGISAYFVSGTEALAAPGMLAYVIALIAFPIQRD